LATRENEDYPRTIINLEAPVTKRAQAGSGILGRTLRIAAALLFAASVFATARTSSAFVNAGAEAGIVKRSAASPNNLKLGVGYGVHADLDLLPLISVGPYYLHYELSSADRPAPGAADAAFNVLGLRGRLTLPIPGSWKPYGLIGIGYTWANYSPAIGDRAGHFFEIPVGAGLAYEVIEIFQLSLDVAYRPGVSFGGQAYETIDKPASGWSVMLGAMIDL
jgi:opacity protein-like surface antigen